MTKVFNHPLNYIYYLIEKPLFIITAWRWISYEEYNIFLIYVLKFIFCQSFMYLDTLRTKCQAIAHLSLYGQVLRYSSRLLSENFRFPVNFLLQLYWQFFLIMHSCFWSCSILFVIHSPFMASWSCRFLCYTLNGFIYQRALVLMAAKVSQSIN